MQAEAAQTKASGIVGVTVEVKNPWGEHATEFLHPRPGLVTAVA
jgi:hypothetical protein